jgi:hypothetical protein
MKTNLLGLIACVALIGVSQARAANIEYHVNASCGLNSPGGLSSVTGTIITNGKVGPMALTKTDIVSWDLTINNKNGVAHISSIHPGSAVEIAGPTLTASSSFLRFDYSNSTYGLLVFGGNASGTIGWENYAIGSPQDAGYSLFYIGPTSTPNPANTLNSSGCGLPYPAGGSAPPPTIGVACPVNARWDERSATCGCYFKNEGIVNGKCVSVSATCPRGDGYIVTANGPQCVPLPKCPSDCKFGCLIDNVPPFPVKFICRREDGQLQ